MEKRNRYKLKEWMSIFLSFLLSLLLSTLLLSISVQVGIGSQKIFVHSVSNGDYYKLLYDKLNSNMDALLEKANLPDYVGEGVISENQVYIDGKVYINSVLKGKHPTIDTTGIDKKLRKNVEAYLSEHSIPLESLKDGIDEVVDTVVIDYKNTLSFKFADYFYEYSKIYQKWGTIVLLTNVILCPIILGVLFSIHKRKHRVIRYISYATITATAINILYTILGLQYIQNLELLQGSSSYHQMAKAYLIEGISQGYYISMAGAMVFFILLAITKLLKNTKYKKVRHGI